MDIECPKPLNIAGVSLAQDVQDREIAVTILRIRPNHITGGRGFITADVAAKGLIERIDDLKLEHPDASGTRARNSVVKIATY